MGRAATVAITGASGLVGSALERHLVSQGRTVRRVVRGAPQRETDIAWDPTGGTVDASALEGVDAIVHLAGESVAEGRWTAEKKRRIRESRVLGTRTLVEALGSIERRPRSLVSASAIGYYGDRGDEWLDERSAPGADFLAEVCQAWESEAQAAEPLGVRVARARIGIVLSPEGGALAKLLPLFRLGAGGPVADGRHFMSWITLRDVVRALEWLVDSEGSIAHNLVAPAPERNADFSRALGRVLRRPALLPAPRFALRAVLGEVTGVLVSSQRVHPSALAAGGFEFLDPTLPAALGNLLGSTGVRP